MRLKFLVVLPALVLTLIGHFAFQKWNTLGEVQVELEEVVARAKAMHLDEEVNPAYFLKEVESMPLRAKLQRKEAILRSHPLFSSLPKKEVTPFAFSRHVFSNGEVVWHLEESVRVSSDELCQLLSAIEGVSIGALTPPKQRPNLTITKCIIDREDSAWKLLLDVHQEAL